MSEGKDPVPPGGPASAPDPNQRGATAQRAENREAQSASASPAGRGASPDSPKARASEGTRDASSQATASPPVLPATARRSSSLAERLRVSGRHPVLLFGTSTSGKSTLLVSLFHSLGTNREVRIRLGEPVADLNTPEGRRAHELALELFERRVAEFDKGVMLESSQLDWPFFVPVDLQKGGHSEPVKLAFLEARGEWFDPSKESKGSIFQGLKAEIVDILKNYPEPLSVLYVAPYSIDDQKGDNTSESDLGLDGTIGAYSEHRRASGQDYHLFLLTKWDKFADPVSDAPKFSRVKPGDVENVLTARYRRSWNSFQKIPLSGSAVRRYFMQYTAGSISDGIVWGPPERQRRTFDRYNRTLWNWLYGNATERTNGDGYPVREELFRGVGPRGGTRMTIVERITSYIFTR